MPIHYDHDQTYVHIILPAPLHSLSPLGRIRSPCLSSIQAVGGPLLSPGMWTLLLLPLLPLLVEQDQGQDLFTQSQLH